MWQEEESHKAGPLGRWKAADKKPTACVNCGSCMKICPQHIEIPRHLRDFAEALSKIPSWREICRQREEAAKNKE